MPETQLIIAAIDTLREDMNQRFDDIKSDTGKVLTDHETRIRNAETTLTRYRTIGTLISGLAAFFGWDSMKHHWTSLMK